MSAATVESLKRDLTDKYVVVAEGVPELRRFSGLTGTVKTVNMSGRALVQFNGPADIGWYDIDPTYLNVVSEPLPEKKAAQEKGGHAPAGTKEKPAVAARKTGALSPLEMARQQGAARADGAASAKPAPEGGKKLSPLELARQQGAAKTGDAGAPPAAAEPDSGKKLSPLELARQQGAAKSADESAPAEQAPPAPSAPAASDDTSGLSKIELARRQGPAKR